MSAPDSCPFCGASWKPSERRRNCIRDHHPRMSGTPEDERTHACYARQIAALETSLKTAREALQIALGEFEIPTFHNTRERMRGRQTLIAQIKAAIAATPIPKQKEQSVFTVSGMTAGCPNCDGTGIYGISECDECNGTGRRAK